MATKKVTKSKVPEKKVFTDSEYSVKRIYQKSSKKRPTEDAGKYPFTRGIPVSYTHLTLPTTPYV